MNAHLYMAHNGRMSMNYTGIGGIFFAENTEIRQKNGWCDTLKRNWSYRRHCFPAGAAKRYRQQNEYCLNIPEYHPEKYPYIVQSVMPLASCWNLLHPAFSVRPVEKPACLSDQLVLQPDRLPEPLSLAVLKYCTVHKNPHYLTQYICQYKNICIPFTHQSCTST